MSEDPTLEVFVPHHDELHASDEPLVWAVDSNFMWLYWFPRDCPRACFWAVEGTTEADVERWLDGDRGRRVAVIEASWLERLRAVALYAYRMPPEAFDVVEDDRFYVASTPVEAIERVEVGDLLARHAAEGIELRVAPSLYPLWDRVVATSLEYSGIRLRNAGR